MTILFFDDAKYADNLFIWILIDLIDDILRSRVNADFTLVRTLSLLLFIISPSIVLLDVEFLKGRVLGSLFVIRTLDKVDLATLSHNYK